jgi:hypothetical protein
MQNIQMPGNPVGNIPGQPQQQGGAGQYLPPQNQQQLQQQQQMYQQQQQQLMQQRAGNGQHPQAPGQQPQQQTTLTGSKPVRKPWHTSEDVITRNNMIERIVGLLQQRRPNATPDWQEKLPHMAKRLENELYQQAESVDEYSDPLTLKNRLQLLALSMGNKQAAKQEANRGNGQPGAQGGQGQVSMMPQGQGQQGQYGSQQQSQSQLMQQQHQQHLNLQQQQNLQNPGNHMRTAQAAAAQYPGQMAQGGPPNNNIGGYNYNNGQGQMDVQQQQVLSCQNHVWL